MVKRITQFKWLALLFIIILFLFQDVETVAYKNLAYLSLNRALGANTATGRQKELTRFLDYWRHARNKEIALPRVDDSTDMTMLSAVFIGEHYRFQGGTDKAASWYLQATQSTPAPFWQDSLVHVVRRGRLLDDGNILIDDFSDVNAWRAAKNNNVVDITFESIDGVALISYQNRPNQRDIVGYILYPGAFQLSYHTVLSVRVKLEPGSFLTVEAMVDGVLERHLNYYREGTGDWETLRFPLTGDELRAVKLIFGESAKPKETNTYRVWVDWIKLELTPDEQPIKE